MHYDDDGYHPRERRSSGTALGLQLSATGHEADWTKLAQDNLKLDIQRKLPRIQKADNLILFIGDGMGPSTVTTARWHQSQEDGTKGYNTHLAWDRWPVTGMAKVRHGVSEGQITLNK